MFASISLWARKGALARRKGFVSALLFSALTATSFFGTVQAQSQTYKAGDLTIEGPWARATPAGAKIGGAYMKITNNGSQPDRLMGGSAENAASVEVHEMSMTNNVMKMRHLQDGLEIKPGQTVELKPGGYHVMLIGLSKGLSQGQKVKGSLTCLLYTSPSPRD